MSNYVKLIIHKRKLYTHIHVQNKTEINYKIKHTNINRYIF